MRAEVVEAVVDAARAALDAWLPYATRNPYHTEAWQRDALDHLRLALDAYDVAAASKLGRGRARKLGVSK